jgi:hypothetical protein
MGYCIWKLSYGPRYLMVVLTPRTGWYSGALAWITALVNQINFTICSQLIYVECSGSMCQIKRNGQNET